MLIFVEIGQSAAGQHLVTLDQLKVFNISGRGQSFQNPERAAGLILSGTDRRAGSLEMPTG
jgi:hypothetical protein